MKNAYAQVQSKLAMTTKAVAKKTVPSASPPDTVKPKNANLVSMGLLLRMTFVCVSVQSMRASVLRVQAGPSLTVSLVLIAAILLRIAQSVIW